MSHTLCSKPIHSYCISMPNGLTQFTSRIVIQIHLNTCYDTEPHLLSLIHQQNVTFILIHSNIFISCFIVFLCCIQKTTSECKCQNFTPLTDIPFKNVFKKQYLFGFISDVLRISAYFIHFNFNSNNIQLYSKNTE